MLRPTVRPLKQSEFFFFQAEDGIRDGRVTGVQTCALPIFGDDVTKKHQVDARISSLQGRLAEHRRRETALRNEVADYTSRIRTLEAKVGDVSRSEERRVGKETVHRVTAVH